MNNVKRLISLTLCALIISSVLFSTGISTNAASKPKLKKKSGSVVIGKIVKIKIKKLPRKAKVTYKSSKKSIASVSKKGKVKGKKAGKAKITVTIKKKGKKTKLTYKIKVYKPSVAKNTTVYLKGTSQIKIKNKPAKAAKAKYKWTSDNKKIVTVNKDGKITGKSLGKTKVKVKVYSGKKFSYKLTTTVTVKRKPIKVTEIIADTTDILVGETKQVIFKATIENAVNKTYNLVDSKKKKIVELKDDGVGFDDIANDHVFSAAASLKSNSVHEAKYYVLVKNKLSSKYVAVMFYKNLTSADNKKYNDLVNDVKKLEKKTANNKNYGKNISKKIISYFNEKKKSGEIVRYTKGKDSVSAKLASGVTYVYSINNNKNIQADTKRKYSSAGSGGSEQNVEIEKNTVASFQPYASELNSNVFDNAAKKVSGSKYNFNTYVNYDNSGVSIPELKNLNKYNVIIWDGHGGHDSYLHSFFGTGTDINDSKNILYSADLQADRIIKLSGGKYGVTSKFFDKYYKKGDFSNTVFYLGACHGAEDNVLANVLISKGVDAFYAYKNSVYTDYNRKMVKTIFEQLTADKKTPVTVSQALTAAKKKHGNLDKTKANWYNILTGTYEPESNRAELKLFGNKNFDLDIVSDLSNLSFERGLKHWKGKGDCRIVNQLSALSPVHGSKMCIIGTGLGAVSDSNSTVERTFKVKGVKQISFYSNYVSEEPMEYFNSKFDDTCIVSTIVNGKLNEDYRFTINSSTWKYLDGNVFYGGDDTTYHTGWKKHTIDLSRYKSDIFTIRFNIYDIGDSAYDSALLIDDIEIKK